MKLAEKAHEPFKSFVSDSAQFSQPVTQRSPETIALTGLIIGLSSSNPTHEVIQAIEPFLWFARFDVE